MLHFTNNPFAQATEARRTEIVDLKSEIVSLKARIKLLEEGQNKDLTLLVGQKLDEEGPSSQEVQKLQSQLQTAETKNKRLMEAFKVRIICPNKLLLYFSLALFLSVI